MKKQVITLRVNGQNYEVAVDHRDTLLSVLRTELGLTGTKEGCGEGQCGTCTVLMNGKAVSSCILLAMEAEGQEITTIEGLAGAGTLDPLQEAFVQRGAIQCGFCTPGMIMSAKALLKEKPQPTEEEIRRSLGGNLCRCTGYSPIVDAVQSAGEATRLGKSLRPEGLKQPAGTTRAVIVGRSPRKKMELVGQPAERVEAAEKATGVALFAADFVMAGMLYGKILRSPHAHARILSIDTSKAEALPGVVAVATEADTPGKRFGFVVADETIFAEDEVRFKSQAVAAVAAVDPYIAEEALGLIEVQYEPLPAVFDMEEAMKPGAPLVHQDASQYGQGAVGIECQLEGNIISHPVVEGGDVEKGFAESDLVLEERYVTAAMHQGYLEPHACLAEFDANGKLTVWTSTQGHFYARGAISAFLDKPMSQVNVIPSEVGGAFGGKITPFIEVIAAVLAKKAAHPVQIVLSRQEDLEDARPRSATVTEVKTGVKRDGTIVARKVRFLVDGGAYADWTPGVAINSAKVARGPYRVPNYRLEAYSVYTNKFITGPMRAPGYPQLFFALESHLDEIAKRLGLTPFEIRLKNGLDAGDVTFVGNRLKTPVFLNMLKRVKKVIDSDPEKNVPNAAWGIGCGEWEIGGAVSGASLKLNEDGTVALLIGSTDLTGSKTSIAQVAAEELSLGLEDLAVTVGDTDTALTAPLSGGSQITYNMTNAVRVAARELTRQILAQGAKVLKVQPSALELKDGKVVVKGDPTKSVSFSDLGEVQLEAAVSCAAIPPAHSFAVQAVKVKVDPETGKVRILRAVGAQDCGTAVNPQSVEAQLGGGMAQCIGHALWEQVVFAEGAVMNNGLTEYTMPTARDVVHFEALLFEGEYGSGKGHGAKGIGEPVHIPAAAAVGNAIYNATGVRLREMPMTPERIWRAIEEAGV